MTDIPSLGLSSSTKFRQSCDKCQNSKLRCSRDKPVCKRCAQRRFRCVYSPLRRIGRPKKAMIETDGRVATSPKQMDVDIDVDVDVDVNEGHENGGSESVAGALLPSPDTSTHNEHSAAAASLCRSGAGHPHSHNLGMSPMRDSEHLPIDSPRAPRDSCLSSVGAEALSRSAVSTCISDHEFSAIQSPQDHPLPAGAHPQLHGGILSVAARPVGAPCIGPSDCCAAVLAHTARLEEALSRTAAPPAIDLVLEAERDFTGLRHRLFACTGHQTSPSPDGTSSLAWTATPTASFTQPCLATDRPVLLSLALLAERVVGMLEEMFRLAARSAQSIDQSSDFVWFATLGTSGPAGPPARRLQRSLRNVTSTPCASLAMDSFRALRLDDFVVEGQAKTDAMGRILKLRVRRMLRAIEVLDGAQQTKQRAERDGRGKPSGGPIGWGSSTTVLDTIAGTLLDDLMRRIESLQGAMMLL
ncbi:hypothetical protein F5Y14DRAFT_285640 [Nemania sp. NC0429]|nr:hypothetical protein F5Y14DRAFT_285640 [Nemania sp. NC0429]